MCSVAISVKFCWKKAPHGTTCNSRKDDNGTAVGRREVGALQQTCTCLFALSHHRLLCHSSLSLTAQARKNHVNDVQRPRPETTGPRQVFIVHPSVPTTPPSPHSPRREPNEFQQLVTARMCGSCRSRKRHLTASNGSRDKTLS